MGKEFGSGVAGEELRGKHKAPSSPCGRWSPNPVAEWEGGRFRCGEAKGESRETDFEQVLIDLDLVLEQRVKRDSRFNSTNYFYCI